MMIQQVKKQQRHEQILLSLDNLTYATQQQLQVINKLGGDRNAHRILHDMEKDKIISSIRTERKIYFLSRQGSEQIGIDHIELKKAEIPHVLMRNDLYIKLGMPADWKKEQPIKWGDHRLIPDVTYRVNNEYHFVEIDYRQQMRTNYEKIEKYTSLSKAIFNTYKHHPTLIWYTLSDVRNGKLKEACTKAGVKFSIY